jgi:DNA-binding response OmpR family regulator
VLFMSGHTDKTIGDYGLDGRDDAILRKAFSPADLARRVRDVLDGNAPASRA